MDTKEKIEKFLNTMKVAENYEMENTPGFKGFDHYFTITQPSESGTPKLIFRNNAPADVKSMLNYAWRDALYGEE